MKSGGYTSENRLNIRYFSLSAIFLLLLNHIASYESETFSPFAHFLMHFISLDAYKLIISSQKVEKRKDDWNWTTLYFFVEELDKKEVRLTFFELSILNGEECLSFFFFLFLFFSFSFPFLWVISKNKFFSWSEKTNNENRQSLTFGFEESVFFVITLPFCKLGFPSSDLTNACLRSPLNYIKSKIKNQFWQINL